MHAHGPSCLPGPVTRDPDKWSVPAGPDSLVKGDGAQHDAPVRHLLIQRVRREIAEGTYDTPEKLEAALDRLLRRLDPDGAGGV
jgi:hypothetical protein